MQNQKRLDRNAWQKEYRIKNKNSHTRIYEKTKSGFLVRLYRNIKSRTSGIQILKAHLYLGLEVLPKEEFYRWANESKEFHALFEVWQASNYERKLTPSVNRIDSKQGYFLDNIEWVTHSVNSQLGAISKYRKTHVN